MTSSLIASSMLRDPLYHIECLTAPPYTKYLISSDHRHRVAGVTDKQLVAAEMGLPHRHRQSRRPTTVQLAKPRIAIPVGTALDVLIPQHRQGDVLALELPVDLGPIGLEVAAMTLLGADGSKQRRLQSSVGHLRRQWPAQPRARQPCQRQPDR